MRWNMKGMDEERVAAIIDAAIEEFNQKTYSKASLNNILKRAGISKGSFYYNFKNKADLYVYLFDYLLGIDKESFNKVIESDSNKLLSFDDIMVQTAQQSMILCKERPDYYLFFKNAVTEPDCEVKPRIDAIQNTFIDEFVMPSYIVPGVNDGTFRDDFSIEFYRRLLSNMMKEITFGIIEIDKENNMDEEKIMSNLHSYLKFFIAGISKV